MRTRYAATLRRFELSGLAWASTCSTRVLIDVCSLVSGTSAMPAATGFRSMYAEMARSDSSSRIATLLNRLSKNAPRTFSSRLASRDERFLQAFHEPTDALQPLAGCRHPRGVLEPILNPIFGNRQRLSGLVARRKEPSPAPHDLLVRPTLGDLRVKPQQQVQVIRHHREPADGHGEDLGKLFDPIFNPRFTVGRPFARAETLGGHSASYSDTSEPRKHQSDACERWPWADLLGDPHTVQNHTKLVKAIALFDLAGFPSAGKRRSAASAVHVLSTAASAVHVLSLFRPARSLVSPASLSFTTGSRQPSRSS